MSTNVNIWVFCNGLVAKNTTEYLYTVFNVDPHNHNQVIPRCVDKLTPLYKLSKLGVVVGNSG